MLYDDLCGELLIFPDRPDDTQPVPIIRPLADAMREEAAMPTAADVLTAGGIQRAAEVVELARLAVVDLACAVVMLCKESSGGRNVWGRDAVDTGGIYVKGSPVTRDAYERYAAARDAKQIGAQGVGPTQLTYPPLQRAADARGGCWDWRTNVLVGFEHLGDLQRRYGVEAGFRAYNGGDSAAKAGVNARADKYGRDAMALLADWQRSLAATTNPTPAPPAPPASRLPTLTYGMRDNTSVGHLQTFLRENYPLYAKALKTDNDYGDKTRAAVLEYQLRSKITNADGSKPDGKTVGDRTNAQLWEDGYRG